MTWLSPVELTAYRRRLKPCEDRQGLVLELVCRFGNVRASCLTENLSITPDNAASVLRTMHLNGKLVRHGRRGHYWYTAA